jgi:hypothetical protein
LTILAKKSLSLKKIQKLKVRGDRKNLREALDSAQFSSHEKSNYLEWMPPENFANITKLSVI